jgi:hypothetical protein
MDVYRVMYRSDEENKRSRWKESQPGHGRCGLYYYDGATRVFWGDLGLEGPPVPFNIYPTHVQRLKVSDTFIVKEWRKTEESAPKNPDFVI